MNPEPRSPRPEPHVVAPLTRREMLCRGGAGFGALALAHMLGADSPAAAAARPNEPDVTPRDRPPAPNQPPVLAGHRLPARAKSVIFLFMEGGPSHIDLFDPKPLLDKLAGKPLPPSFKPVITPMGEFHSPVLALPRKWRRHGASGLWVSDWLPEIARHADDLAVIRSCWSNGLNHVGGVCQMNTGSVLAGRPCLGSWAAYGLGSENQNLPAFVVMRDHPATVAGGPRNWGAGFMPATWQGVEIKTDGLPIPNLAPTDAESRTDPRSDRRRASLELLDHLNRRHLQRHPEQSELDARIRSYELAFRMQAEAPDAVDLADESPDTLALYGADVEPTARFGRACVLARRLVERGVRFVQLYHGAGSKWDSHSDMERNHARQCREMDRPVAGLLADLKRRGLLDTTLVVWGGEFGRTPQSEKGTGRDHNPYGFTMWMAGGGVPPGTTIGSTDEVGLHAVEDRMHVHDLHATILRLLGADHAKLHYLHKGRPERPTVNEGDIQTKLLPPEMRAPAV